MAQSDRTQSQMKLRRTFVMAALGLTALAPAGSYVYAVHIWLHSWTDRTIVVNGMERGIVLQRAVAH